jgi:hypothetical protein
MRLFMPLTLNGLALQQGLRSIGELVWQVQVRQDIAVNNSHLWPAFLAASMSFAVNGPGSKLARSSRARANRSLGVTRLGTLFDFSGHSDLAEGVTDGDARAANGGAT